MKSYSTLYYSRGSSTSGFLVLHHLPEFAQTHVHIILQARIPDPFFRGSFHPMDRTQVSRGTDRLFTVWATGEAPLLVYWPVFMPVPYWSPLLRASQMALVGKNLLASVGDVRAAGSVLRSGRSLGGGHGNPLQYYCLEKPRDRGAWQTTVYRFAKSWTWLKQLSTHTYFSDDSCFILLLGISLVIWSLFWFHINFRSVLFLLPLTMPIEVLIGIALNLQLASGSIDTLAIFIPPIHDHETHFHLFVSWASFINVL